MKQFLHCCCLLLAILGVATRSHAYWQQRVDTRIAVQLDDEQHVLRGSLSLDYYNQSPDTLHFIYFHLYPNAYSSDRTAYTRQVVENGSTDFYFSKPADRGGIDSLNFAQLVATQMEEKVVLGVVTTVAPDIIKLILASPLIPGAAITITTSFRVKIPVVFSRLGHEGQAYQISQWFPKPAVYDAQGWHPYPYLDQGEFYSEFGSYKVAITLPENYILMATGNIQEPEAQRWLDSLAALPLPSDTLYKQSTPASSTRYKTVTFKEDHIHDFAWFADKRWVVRKQMVALPTTTDSVAAYTCFWPAHQKGWERSTESLRVTLETLSSRVGPYPYKTIKAVEGSLKAGGAMEYPTITVVSASEDKETVHTAIVHEAGHNWFYGILGSNERLHPWMDESINSYYEHQIAPDTGRLAQLTGGLGINYLGFAATAATHDLLPVTTASTGFPNLNYGTDIYGKGAFYFDWLEAYMSPEHFQSAMQEYFQTWTFKHPQPEDFEAIFRKHSNKDLDWFFKELMPTSKGVDFAIGPVKRNEKGTTVVVRNKTGIKVPALVQLSSAEQETTSIWTAPFTGTTRLHFEQQTGTAAISTAITDYNLKNNREHTVVSFRPFVGGNMGPAYKNWILPAIGYNVYDRLMLGLVLHNFSVPKNKFQYALAPMYAFGSKQVAGTGIIGYTFYSDQGWMKQVQLNLGAKTYAYDRNNQHINHYLYKRFLKVAPELIVQLRNADSRSSVRREISVKGFWIREGQLEFNQDPVDSLYRPSAGTSKDNIYGRVRYRHEQNRTFNPFNYTFEGQLGQQFAKISLEANLKIDYHLKNKGLHLRGFAGKFFNFADNHFDSYRYRLTNTFSGVNDYLYEDTYFGRTEITDISSQQISMREGGFKINTLQYASQIGLSDDWLFAINLKSDLPLGRLPLRLFADVSTFSGARGANPSGAGILYAAGLEVYIDKYFSLYVPLIMSKDFSEYQKAIFPQDRFWHSLSFQINLQDIDWMNLSSGLLRL